MNSGDGLANTSLLKLLIQQMKYFESFLAENEGNSDLDISVYCDIDIFEWLINYIHEPSSTPYLDKSIVVSILISSEFLQMEELVNLCLKSIAGRLDEIIALPIDLSCISDKLVNMLATLTHPKVRLLSWIYLLKYLASSLSNNMTQHLFKIVPIKSQKNSYRLFCTLCSDCITYFDHQQPERCQSLWFVNFNSCLCMSSLLVFSKVSCNDWKKECILIQK